MVLRFNTFPSSLTYNLSSPPSLLVSCPSKGILFSWQMSNCSVQWLFLLWQLRHNCLSALGFTCLLSSWLQHSWKTLCISAAFGSEPPLRTLTFFCRLAVMNSCVFSLLRLLLSSLSFVPWILLYLGCAIHNNKGGALSITTACRTHDLQNSVPGCGSSMLVSRRLKVHEDLNRHVLVWRRLCWHVLPCFILQLALRNSISAGRLLLCQVWIARLPKLRYPIPFLLQLASCHSSTSWRAPLVPSLSCKAGQA